MGDHDVVVIGAGAAGLIAAGRAAELGGKVLLLEKMERAGKKITDHRERALQHYQ